MSFSGFQAYGLSVACEFECPWLLPAHEAPAVHIRYGLTPRDLGETAVKGLRFQLTDRAFMFWVDDLARFYVHDGQEIVVETSEGADPGAVNLYLLGTAMGALLYQRGVLPLHASAVVYQGKALCFTGPSGIGKSTTAAALCQAGAQLLADDVSPMDFVKNEVWVRPGFPIQNLWPDSLEALGLDPHSFPLVQPNVNKHLTPVADEAPPSSARLRVVYQLTISDGEAVVLTPLMGTERFFALESNLYRAYLAKSLLGKAVLFQMLAQFASVPVVRVVRPRHGFKLEALCQAILQDLNLR